MFWSLSFQLLPDETIMEDSTQRSFSAIKPAYAVFLTNKRAIFRFNVLGSTMTQSFFYHEIVDVKPSKRLFITYLLVKTTNRDFLLNTADAEYWADKILGMKKKSAVSEHVKQPLTPERTKRDLLDMLTILRKNAILTDEELEEKIELLASMKM